MPTIIPAIIPETYDELTEKVKLVKGMVKRVQVDVLDGKYTQTPASWPYNGKDEQAFEKLVSQQEGLPFWHDIDYEIDLMVKKPEEKIEDWIKAGAAALIIHIESTERLPDIFASIEERGVEIGLALKPSTDIELLAPWVLHASFIQCMGSDTIGAQGIELDPRVVGKIKDIHTRFKDSILGIDIGVTEETAPLLVEAGATRLVSGSAIFSNGNVRDAIARLSGE